jgi:alpha-L-arabinofuranosidase
MQDIPHGIEYGSKEGEKGQERSHTNIKNVFVIEPLREFDVQRRKADGDRKVDICFDEWNNCVNGVKKRQ